MQQKWDQGTLGTQRSRTHLGPSMDPAMALQYTKHSPFYIGYILHSMQQKWDHGQFSQLLTIMTKTWSLHF